MAAKKGAKNETKKKKAIRKTVRKKASARKRLTPRVAASVCKFDVDSVRSGDVALVAAIVSGDD